MKKKDPKLPVPNLQTGTPTEKELFARDKIGDLLLRRLNELLPDWTSSVMDEGVYLGEATGFNFVGDGVTASMSTTYPGLAEIDITGGSGGGDTITATASEDIAAGQFVAVYDDSGTPKCRVAKSSSGQGFQADGFCKDAFSSGATATIFLPGAVNVAGGTGLTAGDVWLGTDGYATDTAPTTAGYISQQIGVAENSTHVAFEPQPDILIATPSTVTYGGTLKSQVFTSSGTFTPDPGVTAVWADLYAAGGAGSGGTATTNGAGGGAGEYCEGFLMPISGAQAVTVGAGGASGSAGANGSSGGNTSFNGFTVLGGAAATGATAGAGGGVRGASGSVGLGALGTSETPSFYGGSSGGGGGSGSGGAAGGGSGGRLTGGAAGSTTSGGGGGAASPVGNGGAGGTANAAGSAAAANSAAGGGGGGGGSNTVGGAGGSGKVVVYWIG